MTLFFSFVSGLIFGLGLIVAGMANPAKVIGFLDLFGPWDPSLAFVMAGGIAIGLAAFQVASRRRRAWSGLPIHLPSTIGIDRRLIFGAALFGAGWGLAGICPGPAFVLMAGGSAKGWVFGVMMLAGMGLFEILERRAKQGS